MTMVVIKKFMYCISMFATKTISLKRQFLLLFQDDKKYKSLICTFPLKKTLFHYFAY